MKRALVLVMLVGCRSSATTPDAPPVGHAPVLPSRLPPRPDAGPRPSLVDAGAPDGGPRPSLVDAGATASTESAVVDTHIVETVRTRYFGQVTHCWKNALKMDPTVRGKLTLIVTTKGADVVAAHATGVSPSVDACIEQAASTWRLPDRDGPDDEPPELRDGDYRVILGLEPAP